MRRAASRVIKGHHVWPEQSLCVHVRAGHSHNFCFVWRRSLLQQVPDDAGSAILRGDHQRGFVKLRVR